MDAFAQNLRARAEALNFTHAELAERLNLDARRFGHYVTGRSEPDLATVVKIARELRTSPNQLLGFETPDSSPLVSQLLTACAYLDESQIAMLLNFAEASSKKT